MKAPTLFALLLTATAAAQLPPILKPHAEQFDRDHLALDTAKEAALKPARDRYLAALATAQKTATAAMKTGDLAAITAEISKATAGVAPAEIPPDLPRSLATERRNFAAAVANVARAIPQRQRELAAKYLQTLAAFGAQAAKAGDATLTAAVNTERARVLPLLEAAGGGQRNRNVVENGEFSAGKPGEWPPGWRPSHDWKRAGDAMLMREGAEQFLRVRRLQAERQVDLSPDKTIAIPAGARAADFTARIRAKGLVPGKEYEKYPALKLTTRDATDTKLTDAKIEATQDGGWKKLSGRVPVPDTAKALRIELGAFGAAGIFDFDDVVVEFR
jgi:hypothetical protein